MSVLRIFICYGGREGERIGANLRRFLRSEGLRAFLASPRSPDIPAGEDYERFIDAQLLSSHLMIPICDKGIHRSQPALREIRLALNARKPVPIVPFVRRRCWLPNLIRNKWAPVRFDPVNPNAAYERLLVEIYRRIDYEREKTEDLQITQPTEFPFTRVLRKILRRR